jgi:hypothetical protein
VHQPTALHAAWNTYWAKKNDVDMADPIRRMTLEQLGGVLLGFFVINTVWIRKFLNSPTASSLRAELTPVVQSLTRPTQPSSRPPTAG